MSYQLQQSFSTGEISPDMYVRTDFGPAYLTAVARLRNMIALPQGPAETRKGFEFIDEFQGVTGVRLFPFDVSIGISFLVAVSPEKIKVFDKAGGISSDDLTIDGDFVGLQPSVDWNPIVASRVTFGDGLCFIRGGVDFQDETQSILLPSGEISQEVTGLTIGENHRFRITATEPGIFYDVVLGTTDKDSGELFDATTTLETFEFSYTPNTTNLWIKIAQSFIETGSPNPRITILDSVELLNINTAAVVEFPSPYTIDELQDIQWGRPPNNKALYLVHRNKNARRINYNESTKTWTLADVAWTFGGTATGVPWSPNDDPPIYHPGSIAFHEGRMWLGGTFNETGTVWGSVPQDYENFDLGAQDKGIDAVVFPLDAFGEIKWLASNKALFAGMDNGEQVFFSEAGVLTVNDAQARQQSAYGSSRVQAVLVEEKTVYLGPQRRIIRGMDYSEKTNGWASGELTFASQHITEGRVKELYTSIVLNKFIFGLLETGEFIMATVEFDKNILGWQRHSTSGIIQSMTMLRENGADVPYIAVERGNSGQGGGLFNYSLERYKWGSEVYLDAYKVVTVSTPLNVISGFDNLEGQYVSVIADGIVLPNTLLVTAGNITLPDSLTATGVIAGYSYTAELETLPPFEENRGGSTYAFKKKYSDLFIQLVDCVRPIVNGLDTFKRSANTPMNIRESNKTELLRVTTSGWGEDASVKISQSKPVKLKISAIGGKLNEKQL